MKGGTGKLKFVSTELTYFFFGIKFVAVKKMAKNLEITTTIINGPCGELI